MEGSLEGGEKGRELVGRRTEKHFDGGFDVCSVIFLPFLFSPQQKIRKLQMQSNSVQSNSITNPIKIKSDNFSQNTTQIITLLRFEFSYLSNIRSLFCRSVARNINSNEQFHKLRIFIRYFGYIPQL